MTYVLGTNADRKKETVVNTYITFCVNNAI